MIGIYKSEKLWLLTTVTDALTTTTASEDATGAVATMKTKNITIKHYESDNRDSR